MDCMVPSALREPCTVKRTVAFADIVGSTALTEQHELEAFHCMRRVLAMLRRNARMLAGRVVNEAGDGALAVFPNTCEAVLWAARCHEAAMHCGRKMPECGVLRLRIGIHVGPVLIYGARVFGLNVVVARRLQQAASPGETLISAPTRDLLPNHAIARTFHVGEIQLKGIPGRVNAYRIDGSPTVTSAIPWKGGQSATAAAAQVAVA
jgi:class 3 adenylate cyclase